MIRWKNNVKSIQNAYTKKMKSGIQESLVLMKDYIDSITPEDTRTLLGNNKIENAQTNGESVSGKVYNDTPYAIFVEYGVSGKAFNYHKPKGVPFYRGIGNRTFARGVDNTKNIILQTIRKAIGQ